MSGMSRELHLRASNWYEQNGLLSEAVDHALAVEAWAKAADLMERLMAIPMFGQGRHATLLAWLEKLPESELLAYGKIRRGCQTFHPKT
jgi:LuxR family maltose regulon positive regulatory protein